MILCVFVNDGTFLKLAIEFDSYFKENVGLKFKVDFIYIKEYIDSFVEDLCNNIIIEVIVLSLIILDKKVSLFRVVDYVI